MSIALDAMGGDFAPDEIVAGALQAAALTERNILLVGDPRRIEPLLGGQCPSNLSIHPASEAVGMDEKPLDSYRKKKDSSIRVGANLVRDGAAGAFVSAGNTGAVSAACLLTWRQLPGIHRPAIASLMPDRHDGFLLLDAGASPDVDPVHLEEFAIMGRAYARLVMGRHSPRVHLLNIGEEPGKGNAFAKQAYSLLARHQWFAGNIEGKDMFGARCDVVVCDAFVGNIVLKTSEGVAELIVSEVRDQIPASPVARMMYAPVRRVMAPLKKKMDYAEYGGSPLLGLKGLCIICHGRSSAKAIKNAVLLADKALGRQLVEGIAASVNEEAASRHA